MIAAATVTRLHTALLDAPGWPQEAESGVAPVWGAIAENHRANALLWAAEDVSRRTDADGAEVVEAKRAIDRLNQQRNDAIERIDVELLAALPPAPAGARLNSETAGSMVDRLSILALRRRALHLQLGRNVEHAVLCRERLAILEIQAGDLAGCLDALLVDAAAGRAAWRVYRALKLYNDTRFRG